jgi:hypothetical protein
MTWQPIPYKLLIFLTVRPFILLRKIRKIRIALQAIKHFFVVAERALHQ